MSIHVFMFVFLLVVSLAPHLAEPRAPRFLAFSSRALPTIAPPVDSPPLPRCVQDHSLLQYALGAR